MYASLGPFLANDGYCSGRISLPQVRNQAIVFVIMDTHELNVLKGCEACDCQFQHFCIVASAGDLTLLGNLPLNLDFHLLETGSIEVAKLGFQF